jgi:hypothetical protein
MKKLMVYPKNKKQSAALKGLFKAFDIRFEVSESAYNPEFVAKIQESKGQVKEGKTRVVNISDL